MANEEDNLDHEVGFTGTGGTVKVGSRTFAVGLAWETITPGKNNNPANIAKESAKQQMADLFCLRPPANMQYGLGAKSVGHKAKMAPLASALTENIEGSFVAVFEVEEGYYVCAVRDDVILAGYDRLFDDKQAAADFFTEVKFNSSWESSFAPEDWNIQDTVHKKIDEILLVKPSSKLFLQPVSSRGTLVKAFLVFVVLFACVAGYLYNQQLEQDKIEEKKAEAIRIQTEKDRIAKTSKPKPIPIPPMPWEGRASMIDVMEACRNAMNTAPLNIPGWLPITMTCQVSDLKNSLKSSLQAIVVMTIRRDGGTLNWIAPFVNKPDFKPVIRPSLNGAQGASNYEVIWNVDVPASATRYVADSPFVNIVKTRLYVTSQFEEIFQIVTIKEEQGPAIEYTVPPPPNTRVAPQKKAYVPFRTLAFAFQTGQDPKEYIATLKPIPLNVLGKLTLDLSNWQWTIEGTVYEKLPLPDDFPKENPNAQK